MLTYKKNFEDVLLKYSESDIMENAVWEWEFDWDFTDKISMNIREKLLRDTGRHLLPIYCPCGKKIKYSIVIKNRLNDNILDISQGCINRVAEWEYIRLDVENFRNDLKRKRDKRLRSIYNKMFDGDYILIEEEPQE